MLIVAGSILYAGFQLREGISAGEGWWRSPEGQLCKVLQARARGKSVVMLSSGLDAFPMLNYSGAKWVSRTGCLWMLPAFHRNAAALAPLEKAPPLEKSITEGLVEDLETRRPLFVIVNESRWKIGFGDTPFNFLEYFLRDGRFAKVWSGYEDRPDLARGFYRVFSLRTAKPSD